MAKIARTFDKHTQGSIHRPLPRESTVQNNDQPPWELASGSGLPPMMFQLRTRDGARTSLPYSDLREVYCRDAGHVMLIVVSAAKYRIEIEGRHLVSLADCFGMGSVRWVQESDPRCDPRPEAAPEVVSITIEILPE